MGLFEDADRKAWICHAEPLSSHWEYALESGHASSSNRLLPSGIFSAFGAFFRHAFPLGPRFAARAGGDGKKAERPARIPFAAFVIFFRLSLRIYR